MQMQLAGRAVCVREITAAALLLALLVFALSSVVGWFDLLSWHDEQRVWQLVLLVFAALLLMQGHANLPSLAFVMLAVLLGLGLVSALQADWPFWALKEWGRYVGLVSLALLLALLARLRWFFFCVLGLLACIGCIHSFQFIAYYLSAFLSGIYMLDAGLLFNGFVNPRFLGQFQVLLMPVLAALVLLLGARRPLLAAVLFIVLTLHWCIAMILGGRGLWLAMVAPALPILLMARRYWLLLVVQLCAGLVGMLLFTLLLHLIPEWLGLKANLHETLREGLSGREKLWLWAWEMARDHPWLGVGPMHYSASYNAIAAHPHQVVLQWLAEWGGGATLLGVLLGAWGMHFGFSRLRHGPTDYIAAALWLAIAGALVLAQVDGVFVMPYTETWLAILVGLAIASWGRVEPAPVVQRFFFIVLAVAPVLIIVNVLVNEVPTLARDSDAYMAEHQTGWTPRFWLQGWIPMNAQ